MSTKLKEAPVVETPANEVKEVVKVEESAVPAAASSLAEMFAEDAGGGFENIGPQNCALPFIAILQSNSPQAMRSNSKYIKGAQAGDLFNTVTGELFPGQSDGDKPGGILFVPAAFDSKMVRWKSRDSGGGLVCSYSEHDPILKTFARDERGRLLDQTTQDIVVQTVYHFGLMIREEGFPELAVISMASTAMKCSRQWNTLMKKIMKRVGSKVFNPPSYSHVYRLTTTGMSRDNYSWFTWSIMTAGEVVDIDTYNLAKQFSKQVAAGEVRVSAPPSDSDVSEGEGQHTSGEEVPF